MGDVAKGIKSFKKGMASEPTEEDNSKSISENSNSDNQDSNNSDNQDSNNKE